MEFSDAAFFAILSEPKKINGDILWEPHSTHPEAFEFEVKISLSPGLDIIVYGYHNPSVPKLNYSLILPDAGRIYALNMGHGHKNPSGNPIGTMHKHRWSEVRQDAKDAYVPDDITAQPSEPEAVWKQFCDEARIIHIGEMLPPIPAYREVPK